MNSRPEDIGGEYFRATAESPPMRPPVSHLLATIAAAVCIIHLASAEDTKRELKEDRYYDGSGDLREVVSYYIDANGRKVRHGETIEYQSYGTITREYRDGREFQTTHRERVAFVHSAGHFELTAASPKNGEIGVELVDIAADGTTRIRVTATNTLHSAKPGEYFTSAGFGQKGLQLITASAGTKTALFVRRSGNTVEMK